MPTLTERKPPKRLPGKARSIDPCAKPKQPQERPGSYDVFYGPFDSWCNVKNPPSHLAAYIPKAIGDGIADDTEALQAAFDFCALMYHDFGMAVPDRVPPVPSPNPPWDNMGYFSDLTWEFTYPGYTWVATDPGYRSSEPGWPKSSGSMPGWHGPEFFVIYIPAGTYRITKTLRMFNRLGVIVCGEDPRTTRIVWDGIDWATTGSHVFSFDLWDNLDMYWSDGGGPAHSSIQRLTFDGRGKARVGVNCAHTGVYGSQGQENGEMRDLYFENLAVGMMLGGWTFIDNWYGGANDATTIVKRCHFIDCKTVGLVTRHFNALYWDCWECLFLRCGYAMINQAGSNYAHNSLFINSALADLMYAGGQGISIRGCVFITTWDAYESDDVLPNYAGRPYFAYMSQYPFGQNMLFQGNLAINAKTTPRVHLNTMGPLAYIDNAFYDTGHLTGTDLGIEPISGNYWFSRQNWDDQWGEGTWSPGYLSGNTHNGDRAKVKPRDQWNGTPDGFTIDDSLPLDYIPPNSLDIDDGLIRQILQASGNSSVIQGVIDRLPEAPVRTDPIGVGIKLTDLRSTDSNWPQMLKAALANAEADKVNLIHFSWGMGTKLYKFEWEWSTFTIPSGKPVVLIGDGPYGTFLGKDRYYDYGLPGGPDFVYDYEPMFHIGNGSAVKFHMENITCTDQTYHWAGTLDNERGMLNIRSGDMPGGRIHGESIYGEMFEVPPGYEWMGSTQSVWAIRGFDHVKTRFDFYWAGAPIEVVGTGTIPTSSEDVMFRLYGGWLWPFHGDPMFRVLNGGSMHMCDEYEENMNGNIDVRGCNGYVVRDNNIRFHMAENLPSPDDYHGKYYDYVGHQIHLSIKQTFSRMKGWVPPPGSSLVIWGMSSDVGLYESDPNFHNHILDWRSTGMPEEWTHANGHDSSVLFGLTHPEGAAIHPNLGIAGNNYHIVWESPAGFWTTLNNCQDFPTQGVSSPVPGNFVMPPMARDAWRYRPFPEPSKITDPNVTDISFHFVAFQGRQQWAVTITKT